MRQYNEIFNIILSFNHHIAKETADMFLDKIQQAPEEIIHQRPIIRITMANLMLNNNRIADNVDYEFQELFKKADKYLPQGSKLIDSRLNIAEGLNVCSIKNPAAGELKKHQDALFNAAPYTGRVMHGSVK